LLSESDLKVADKAKNSFIWNGREGEKRGKGEEKWRGKGRGESWSLVGAKLRSLENRVLFMG